MRLHHPRAARNRTIDLGDVLLELRSYEFRNAIGAVGVLAGFDSENVAYWLRIAADFAGEEGSRSRGLHGVFHVYIDGWDFIYAEYVMAAGIQNRSIIWQIAEDYSHCEFLIRLPGYCPMPAFRDVIDVPLVVRRLHKSRAEVRKELGIGDDVKLLVYNFGGQLAGWQLKKEYLPDGWICLVSFPDSLWQELPPNFVKLPKEFYTPDAIAASDVMLGKIGYGTASEALAYNVPFVFVRRDYFNEEPFLRNLVEFSGVRRLRDAIVLGYQLQRISGTDIAVPDWYSLAQTELSFSFTNQQIIKLLSPNVKSIEAPGRLDVMGGIATIREKPGSAGKGVSSSASIEVASMSAVAAAHGLEISPRDLALLCQKACVENCVVGAPCGVMDQMASACGEEKKLLAMVCQPAEVLGLVEIPLYIRFWGIDSGIRHSVGGGDYKSVRIGTYMGRKMIKSMASEWLHSSMSNNIAEQGDDINSDELDEGSRNLFETEASSGYLCNLSPHSCLCKQTTESVSGKEFVQKYADHDDSVTKIDENLSYAVQAPTRHPVYENFRVKAFKALLSAAPSDHQLYSLGQLMYQSRFSRMHERLDHRLPILASYLIYSACGLGSDGTDRLVGLVQEMQHLKSPKSDDSNLFGAKITGGGSGGDRIFKGEYKAATGYLPYVFEGFFARANNASMPWNLTLSAEQSAAFGALRFHDFNLLIDEKRRAILEGAIEFFGSQHQSLA
nr:L-arabinokinase-like isoform X1 [Ipomoea batatas]